MITPEYPQLLGYVLTSNDYMGRHRYYGAHQRLTKRISARGPLFATASAAWDARGNLQVYTRSTNICVHEVILSRHGGRRSIQPPMSEQALFERIASEECAE